MLTDGEKERIKLRANWLNSLSAATFAVGTLASTVRLVSDETVTLRTALVLVGLSILCFALSYALHSLARAGLRRLDDDVG